MQLRTVFRRALLIGAFASCGYGLWTRHSEVTDQVEKFEAVVENQYAQTPDPSKPTTFDYEGLAQAGERADGANKFIFGGAAALGLLALSRRRKPSR